MQTKIYSLVSLNLDLKSRSRILTQPVYFDCPYSIGSNYWDINQGNSNYVSPEMKE